MLLSAVIFMQPAERGAIPSDQGRSMDAIFRGWVKEMDEGLWSALHPTAGETNGAAAMNGKFTGIQPYTISNLHGAAPPQEKLYLDPGSSVWWRITSLDPALSCFILQLLRDKVRQHSPCVIGGQAFYPTGFEIDASRYCWAGHTTYDELCRRYLMSESLPSGKFRLVFDSPTYLSDKDKVVPFPLPELMVKQWMRKWNGRVSWLQNWPSRNEWLARSDESNQFIPADDGLLEFARTSVGANYYSLQTAQSSYFRTPFIGFTGTCSYKVLNSHPTWSRWLEALVHFAFYCGTGGKTSFGFGQTCIP